MEKNCPFCGAKSKSVEYDEDYGGYSHHVFKCVTAYSYYGGRWTNMPSFGPGCKIATILNPEEHFTDLHRIQEMYDIRMAEHAKNAELEEKRDNGEIVPVSVKFDRGYKEYVYEAPAGTEVGDVVVVETSYSSIGYQTAKVTKLGGEYEGKLAQVVEVIKKRK